MASKKQERIYLEWFLRNKGIDYKSIEEHDPPDFVVTLKAKRISVEVTNIYYESKLGHKGSERKRQESHRAKWLKELSDSYYRQNNVPISVKILLTQYSSYPDISSDIQSILSKSSELTVGENKRYVVESPQGAIKVFVRRISDNFKRYSRWSCVNDQVGFVASVTDEHILDAINKKKGKTVLYQVDCDELWLLLVLDRSRKSGLLQYSGIKPCIENSGFDAVWLLEYPEQSHQLLGNNLS